MRPTPQTPRRHRRQPPRDRKNVGSADTGADIQQTPKSPRKSDTSRGPVGKNVGSMSAGYFWRCRPNVGPPEVVSCAS
jgi:hypothetical protein